MAEKRRTKRKDVKVKEGSIAYRWTHGDKRPKGLAVQDIVDKAFQALEQAQSPKTKEEKALAIHKECRAKVSELLPSAWWVYQFAEVLLIHVAKGTPVPKLVWEMYEKEIELVIKSGTPPGTPIQSSKAHFVSGLPQVKSGLPVDPMQPDPQPERLSPAWFEREIYNVNALLQYYSHDPELRTKAINWLHELKDKATDIQKNKPDLAIEALLDKINAIIKSTEFTDHTHPS